MICFGCDADGLFGMGPRAEHKERHHHFSKLPVADEETGGTADLFYRPQADEGDTHQVNDNDCPVNKFKT